MASLPVAGLGGLWRRRDPRRRGAGGPLGQLVRRRHGDGHGRSHPLGGRRPYGGGDGGLTSDNPHVERAPLRLAERLLEAGAPELAASAVGLPHALEPLWTYLPGAGAL